MAEGHSMRRGVLAAQREVWVAQQLQPLSPRFNCGVFLDIGEALDAAVLHRAVARALDETEALRARFVEQDGEITQIIQPAPADSVTTVDVRDAGDPVAAARQWMDADLAEPVDLRRDRSYRHVLFRVGERRSFLYFRYHHITLDGFGQTLYLSRVADLYTALAAAVEPGGSPFGGLDRLLDEERHYEDSDRFTEDRSYWRNAARFLAEGQGGGAAAASDQVLRDTVRLPRELADAVCAYARAHGSRWSVVMLSVVAACAQRRQGDDALVIDLPLIARTTRAALTTPGMMSNVLPLRLAVERDTDLPALMEQVSRGLAPTLRHQRFRGEELYRELGVGGARGHLSVNLMPFDHQVRFGTTPAILHQLANGQVHDVAIDVYGTPDKGGDLYVTVHANARTHTAEDVRQWQQGLRRMLVQLFEVPGRTLGEVELLDEGTRHQVVVEWNDTAAKLPDGTALDWFEDQAAANGHAMAVADGSTALRYDELNARANRLARVLIDRGVGAEDFVAVLLPRSAELLVALLAVWKAGAAYVPIDPEYPAERIAHILDDARPAVTLTCADLVDRMPGNAPSVELDSPALEAECQAREAGNITAGEQLRPLPPERAAYVIYTSGSTGRPKGVVVE
ncbi:condensation domain-containing protein, partial [Streptomyces chlorus]